MINTLYNPIISMPQNRPKIKSPLSNLLQKIDTICVLFIESLDTQSLLNNSLKETLALLNSQRGSIFILDRQTDELTLKASIGMKVDEQKQMVKRLGQGIVGQVALLKEPLLVEHISNEKRFKNYKSRSSYKSESFICSPLLIKDQLIGVINISDKISRKPFTQREFQLFNFLSSQIALNYNHILMTHQLESQERLVSLGKLAGGIAHEFNNPLDGVMRYTKLCLDHVVDDEVLREYLTEVQSGLKRMANIVKNLLACARQSPGSIHKVNIHKTIEQALKELYPYFASKKINLVKNFAHSLPDITDWGVERIVSNLVKNAIDAIDKNGTIEITTLWEDGYITLQVSDTGQGISDKNLEKIFEPFFTTKDIDQGCGLGLTVVNEIIKYYNGKIEVKSHSPQGTTFTVKLPVTP